jgi:transposase-like protein
MTALTARQFTEETAAVAHVEASRWADGVTCPHCGSVNVRRMEGKTQAGYFLCNDCRDKFTCRTGTVMERSHIPVHKWLLAIHLMSTAKNGMSAHELHRNLGITYKSAWFLAHRIRKAMDDDKTTPIGGEGGQVQADEAFIGSTSKRAKNYDKSRKNKNGIVAIVDPQTGEVRAKAHRQRPRIPRCEHGSQVNASDRRSQALHPHWQGIRGARDREPLAERIQKQARLFDE